MKGPTRVLCIVAQGFEGLRPLGECTSPLQYICPPYIGGRRCSYQETSLRVALAMSILMPAPLKTRSAALQMVSGLVYY